MLTIKYRDRDGYDRLSEARDIRAKMDGRFASHLGWINGEDEACTIDFETTAYVMNEGGSTVAKYVLLGDNHVPKDYGAGERARRRPAKDLPYP